MMEKGMSSVEVLPSRSSPAASVRAMVKEHEAKQTQKARRVGFVLVHAGRIEWTGGQGVAIAA